MINQTKTTIELKIKLFELLLKISCYLNFSKWENLKNNLQKGAPIGKAKASSSQMVWSCISVGCCKMMKKAGGTGLKQCIVMMADGPTVLGYWLQSG